MTSRMVDTSDRHPEPSTIEPRLREILGGVATFRILAVAWAFAVVVIDAQSAVLVHRSVAFSVLALMSLWSGLLGIWAKTSPRRLLRPVIITGDLAVAATIMATDWLVYSGPHPQSFGSAWPVTAVVSAAAILGWRVGLAAGSLLGTVNIVAAASAGRLSGNVLALCGSLILLATTGAMAGYVATRLRLAESEVADVRARERFARSLHDGVLQTLAVIQRRSDDSSLIELAREQEWELRDFINSGTADQADLLSLLRGSASRAERFGFTKVVLVVIDTPTPSKQSVTAIAGAATEAITNAAKHGNASTITVCVDRERGGALVTINDDGDGFNVGSTTHGVGLSRSIHARMSEAHGTVDIRSLTGRGTEVRLWVP